MRIYIKKYILRFINYLTLYKYKDFKNCELQYTNDKKIILVSHNSYFGGAPILLLYIAKYLIKYGYDVVIITRNYGPLLEEFRKTCYTKVVMGEKAIIKTIRNLNAYGYRNIILNTVVNGDLVSDLSSMNMNVITLIHELPNAIKELHCEVNAIKIAQLSNIVVFPSEFVYDKFKNLTNIECNYKIKPQGLYYVNERMPKNQAKSYIENHFKTDLSNNIVLNVASINYRKGFDIFLNIARLNPSKQFIWVGDINNKYYKQCINDNQKVPENLFLPGYVEDLNLLNYFYNLADIFLLTSREEPFGTVVLEAFNAAIPVVAFENCGGYVDIVLNNETGILVKQDSINDMNEAINSLFREKDLKNKLGENGKKLIGKYTFEGYVKFLDELYYTKERLKK